MKKTILLFCFYTLIGKLLFSQESHYWSVEQGAYAALIGGAAVADLTDQGASFYNPGFSPFLDSSGISANSSTAFLNILNIENGAGTNLDLSNVSFNLIPQSLSGVIKKPENDQWTTSYSVLNYQYSYFKLNLKTRDSIDVIDEFPGDEEYLGGYNYRNRSREDWAGIAVGYRPNDRFGIGLSTFLVVKTIDYTQGWNGNATTFNDSLFVFRTVATSTYSEDIDYASLGVLWKLGLAYNSPKFRLGLTVTSPLVNLNIFAKATVSRDLFVSSDDLSTENSKIITYQEKINTRNRKPLNVDIGAAYSFKNSTLSVRLGYFAKLGKYDLLHADEFQSFSENFDTIVDFGVPRMAHKPVLNFGIGLRQHVSDKIDILAGFRTDFNYFDEDALQRLNDFAPIIDYWDLYHISGGVAWRINSITFVVGLSYTLGRSSGDQQLVNLTEPKEELLLFGERQFNTNTQINRFNLHLGFLTSF